ncbi:lipid binding protein [Gordonia phage Tarzan]|uniref:Lipid binding protein n=1 Tax=Gordonia phage Tarzan TaxID=3038367 RepID=A0AAF0K1F7_9CAUD|nr:lipid binding protein [Gordonia phage Tarzan]WGH20064.1 lipid binding protein [Gordonia phage Tarzan]
MCRTVPDMRTAQIALTVAAAGILALAGCSSSDSSPDRDADVRAACETALAERLTSMGFDEAKPQEDSVEIESTDGQWVETGTVFAIKTTESGDPSAVNEVSFECTAKAGEGEAIEAEAVLTLAP